MQIQIGDKVALSAVFLRSIADYSYASASVRGRILGITAYPRYRGDPDGFKIARIEWNAPAAWSPKVNVANLVRADRLYLEPR